MVSVLKMQGLETKIVSLSKFTKGADDVIRMIYCCGDSSRSGILEGVIVDMCLGKWVEEEGITPSSLMNFDHGRVGTI